MGRGAAERPLLWDLGTFGGIFTPLRALVKKNTSRAPQRGGKKKKTMPVAKNEKTPRRVAMRAGGHPLNQRRCLEGVPGSQALTAAIHPLHILAFFSADLRSN